MKLEKQKLNDGSYDYFYGFDRVDCANEITDDKITIYVYSDYYQFRHRPTVFVFSTTELPLRQNADGNLTLHKIVTMWKQGINVLIEENQNENSNN